MHVFGTSRIITFAAIAAAGCVEVNEPVVEWSADPVLSRGAVDLPEVFAPDVISDGRWQWRITFTPDGRTAYFSVSDEFFPASRQATIMMSRRQRDGTWSAPEVAPFSGVFSDIDPFITPNGRRLYFSSVRTVDGVLNQDLDIWFVERTRHGWSEPVHLGHAINSEGDELYPSVSARGALYFASGPPAPTPSADWDLFRARRAGRGFAAREPLTALNTDEPFDPDNPQADWEFNPEISIDGRTLVFASLRPGGFGLGDLYVSHRRYGEWGPPENIGPPVNTENDEFHPTLSRDRRLLYFARTTFAPEFRPSDFYRIRTKALLLLFRRPG